MKKIKYVVLLVLGILSLTFHAVTIESSPTSLSFTVENNRVVYDVAAKTVTIPVKVNQNLSTDQLKVMLTYGWDGHGSANTVIGENVLPNVQWQSGVEYFLIIYSEMSIDEMKSKNKLDLVFYYNGETSVTENLRPVQWTIRSKDNDDSSSGSIDSSSSDSDENSDSNSGSIDSSSSDSDESSDSSSGSIDSSSSDSHGSNTSNVDIRNGNGTNHSAARRRASNSLINDFKKTSRSSQDVLPKTNSEDQKIIGILSAVYLKYNQ
ncbi:hypothetical protein [Enterococcus ratti]|uniref:SgrA-like Ig-like domain-containing protein n=1 Tax=Enterococcus ratti TaxID=150033 RepID=A0A1L8WPD0_9ENTE|nr:hypothetical protein [Enterococcus ratti]OJG82874.1 hypothetical protein RV14_GL002166 [Enterococcus ratti]